MTSKHFIIYLAFACFVTDSARAAVCTQEIEAECSIGVDFSKVSEGGMSPEDLSKVCGAYSCIMSKNCEPSMIYTAFKTVCGQVADGVCSMGQIMSCVGDKDLSAFQGNDIPSSDDLRSLCGIIPCVTNLDCEVPPEMSGIMEMKNYCPGANGGGCDLVKVAACVQSMMGFVTMLNGSMKSFDESACQKLSEAVDCIAEVKKCPMEDKDKKNMEDIPDMDSLSKCCNNIVATKNKCYTSDLEFKDESLVTCKQKETAFSCLMANDLKCDGEAGELIYQVKKEGVEAMKDCENKGYNVTVSLQTGKPLDGENKGYHVTVSLQTDKPPGGENKGENVAVSLQTDKPPGGENKGENVAVSLQTDKPLGGDTKGDNVSVSLQTDKPLGGTGMTVLPSASVVFGLMLAMAAWWL